MLLTVVRYIALLAMVKITPTHPHMVAEYQEEIMQSLDDADLSIRMRALELITAMVRTLHKVADGRSTERTSKPSWTSCSHT